MGDENVPGAKSAAREQNEVDCTRRVPSPCLRAVPGRGDPKFSSRKHARVVAGTPGGCGFGPAVDTNDYCQVAVERAR